MICDDIHVILDQGPKELGAKPTRHPGPLLWFARVDVGRPARPTTTTNNPLSTTPTLQFTLNNATVWIDIFLEYVQILTEFA